MRLTAARGPARVAQPRDWSCHLLTLLHLHSTPVEKTSRFRINVDSCECITESRDTRTFCSKNNLHLGIIWMAHQKLKSVFALDGYKRTVKRGKSKYFTATPSKFNASTICGTGSVSRLSKDPSMGAQNRKTHAPAYAAAPWPVPPPLLLLRSVPISSAAAAPEEEEAAEAKCLFPWGTNPAAEAVAESVTR